MSSLRLTIAIFLSLYLSLKSEFSKVLLILDDSANEILRAALRANKPLQTTSVKLFAAAVERRGPFLEGKAESYSTIKE